MRDGFAHRVVAARKTSRASEVGSGLADAEKEPWSNLLLAGLASAFMASVEAGKCRLFSEVLTSLTSMWIYVYMWSYAKQPYNCQQIEIDTALQLVQNSTKITRQETWFDRRKENVLISSLKRPL